MRKGLVHIWSLLQIAIHVIKGEKVRSEDSPCPSVCVSADGKLDRDEPNCKVKFLDGLLEDVEVKLMHECHNYPNAPLLMVYLKRDTCPQLIGSLSFLYHPRVYWVFSNRQCFGDAVSSTSYTMHLPPTMGEFQLARTKAIGFASLFLPKEPSKWQSWQQHLSLLRKASSEGAIEVSINEQYTARMVPKIESTRKRFCMEKRQITPPISLQRSQVNVSIAEEVVQQFWLGKSLLESLESRKCAPDMLKVQDSSKSQIHLSSNRGFSSRAFCRRQICPSSQKCPLPVIIAWNPNSNNPCVGALNLNTKSFSGSTAVTTGLFLPPRSLMQGGKIVSEGKQEFSRRYVASFMGTHLKDQGLHDQGGIVRHLLQFLDDPMRGFVVYTRCHEAHKSSACTNSFEVERRENFLRKPLYNYKQLMKNSKFCLVPRGRQPATYRFLEAILYGCVPVYVSDPEDCFMYRFMFDQSIPWEKVSFYIHGAAVGKIQDFLSNITEEEWAERAAFLQVLANTKFRSTQSIACEILKTIHDIIRS